MKKTKAAPQSFLMLIIAFINLSVLSADNIMPDQLEKNPTVTAYLATTGEVVVSVSKNMKEEDSKQIRESLKASCQGSVLTGNFVVSNTVNGVVDNLGRAGKPICEAIEKELQNRAFP